MRNMRAGRMVQTQEPMVLPTRPRTSSMSGTRIPITRQIKMTAAVIMLILEEKRTKCVFFPNDREPGRRDVVVYQFG